MNEITRSILEKLLHKKEYWHARNREPKMGAINHDYEIMREGMFYDEIYFPRLQQFMEQLITEGKIKKSKTRIHMMGYDKEIKIRYPIDDDMQEWVGEQLKEELDEVWNGDKWGWEEITKDDVLSMNIYPFAEQLSFL